MQRIPNPMSPSVEEARSAIDWSIPTTGFSTIAQQHRRRISSISSCRSSASPPNHRFANPLSPSSTPPKTIILSAWPGATDSQLTHYVSGYRTLAERTGVSQIREADFATAAATTTTTAAHECRDAAAPSILLHLFGNGSGALACGFLRAYRGSLARPLPVRAVVMDTEPSSLSSLSTALRRSVAASRPLDALQCLLLHLWRFLLSLFGGGSSAPGRDLWDPELLPAEARKCYVFAEKDVVFSWREARDPERKGEGMERKEWAVKRDAVDRAGRWAGDEERYWLGIEDVWGGRA
ncbi:hypothetical protein H2203_003578 [Taxawa tesnikishii (nom. ined.)]|nr:hypothetical protein H2203_003578 [Dothideales sp. JES 119]